MEEIIEEVVKKAQDGDAEAMEYILDKYSALICKYVNQYYIHGGEREDVYQEGLIAVWIAIKEYKATSKCSFWTFANLCIKRHILNLVKKHNRIKHNILNNAMYSDGINNIIADYRHPEERVINIVVVKEILDNLSALECKVVMLYSVGFSLNEIAQRIMVSRKTVDNALQRVRRKAINMGNKIAISKGTQSGLDRLSKMEYDVVTLRNEGLSNVEIAQKLNLNNPQVRGALHRAKTKGKKILHFYEIFTRKTGKNKDRKKGQKSSSLLETKKI